MSEDAKQVFAQNLKRYLEMKGLTQLELAEHMGCSSSTVSDWCNGKKYPRVDKMQRIADFLGGSDVGTNQSARRDRLQRLQLRPVS